MNIRWSTELLQYCAVLLLDAGPVSFRAVYTMKVMGSSEGKPAFLSITGREEGEQKHKTTAELFPQLLSAFQSLKKQCLLITCIGSIC